MSDERRFPQALATLLILALAGCAGYGSVRPAPSGAGALTIADLVADASSYTIYSAGVGLDNPSGLLFVPNQRAASVTLGPMWRSVEAPGDLQRLLRALDFPAEWPGYAVGLRHVLGPRGEFIAYLYSGWSHLTVKQRDATGVWLSDIPDPPQYLGDDKVWNRE